MQSRAMVTDPAPRGTSSRGGAVPAPTSGDASVGEGAPHGSPSPRTRGIPRSILGVLGVIGFMATWEIAARTELVNPKYLPPFTETTARLVTELGNPAFWTALSDTLVTWALGLGLASIAAVVAGTVVGLVPFLRRATHTTVEFLRPIPSVAIIPLAILVAGLSREAALVVVIYAPFWQIFIQVLYGIADVDTVAEDTARSFGLKRRHRLRHLVLPTALPYAITGFRLAASIALVLTITAELIIKNPGLGVLIDKYRTAPDVPGLYALVLVTGLLGLVVNLGTRIAERRLLHWHPSVRKEGVA